MLHISIFMIWRNHLLSWFQIARYCIFGWFYVFYSALRITTLSLYFSLSRPIWNWQEVWTNRIKNTIAKFSPPKMITFYKILQGYTGLTLSTTPGVARSGLTQLESIYKLSQVWWSFIWISLNFYLILVEIWTTILLNNGSCFQCIWCSLWCRWTMRSQ